MDSRGAFRKRKTAGRGEEVPRQGAKNNGNGWGDEEFGMRRFSRQGAKNAKKRPERG